MTKIGEGAAPGTFGVSDGRFRDGRSRGVPCQVQQDGVTGRALDPELERAGRSCKFSSIPRTRNADHPWATTQTFGPGGRPVK